VYKKLLNAVTNLGAPKVLLVGDFMLDSYVYGDALRISPEAPVPVLKVVNREHRCGGAGSVAVNLAALGAKCFCIGAIGNDQNGKILTELLKEAGADISGLVQIPNRPTISKQRLVGLAQHRHRQQLLRIDDESAEPLEENQYDKILKAFQARLTEVDIVCLQDYNKAILHPKLCSQFIKAALKHKKFVLVDPPCIEDYSKFKHASLITPNRREASMAAGFDIESIEDAQRAADTIVKKYSLNAVVITLDKEGAFLRTDKTAKYISTIPRSVYDVTGAGDMVLAALTVSLAAGCDYETAVELANVAGGIEVEKFGAAPVSVDEIANEIIAQNRDKTSKLRDIDSLAKELQFHRSQKQSVVFTNGCFDVIHRGHIEFLKFCKKQGDIVVLALNSDSSVKKIKGPERPINNQHDRAVVLAALETIDYIVIFEEIDPLKTIETLEPDILVKGQDWQHKGVVGREFVESYGGKVILAPLVDGKSSTDTINKIKSIQQNASQTEQDIN
jgi:D-beta-D-heptose 7-phosphate kinase/D-beta-D-heptose 1-phosphate adenosyltransferase